MSNDFNDDFDNDYIDDNENFYGDEETASGGSSGSPFLIALLALIGVFVISALCIMVVINSRRTDNGQADAIAAIEATNAAIQETNIAVTVAIQATETARAEQAAVQPTFTPEVENTPTPEIAPTETPVVDQATPITDASDGNGSDGSDGSDGADGSDGSDSGEGGEGTDGSDSSAGGTIIIGATATATPTPISAGGGKDNTLPDTGLEVWGFALIGLVLIAILFAARRLRTN